MFLILHYYKQNESHSVSSPQNSKDQNLYLKIYIVSYEIYDFWFLKKKLGAH